MQLAGQAIKVSQQLWREAHALLQGLAAQGKASLPRQAHWARRVERAAGEYQSAQETGFIGERFQAAEEARVDDHGGGRGAPLLRGILAPMAGQPGRQGFDQQRQGKAFVAKGLAAEGQDAALRAGKEIDRVIRSAARHCSPVPGAAGGCRHRGTGQPAQG